MEVVEKPDEIIPNKIVIKFSGAQNTIHYVGYEAHDKAVQVTLQ
jgi:hypothetical protein